MPCKNTGFDIVLMGTCLSPYLPPSTSGMKALSQVPGRPHFGADAWMKTTAAKDMEHFQPALFPTRRPTRRAPPPPPPPRRSLWPRPGQLNLRQAEQQRSGVVLIQNCSFSSSVQKKFRLHQGYCRLLLAPNLGGSMSTEGLIPALPICLHREADAEEKHLPVVNVNVNANANVNANINVNTSWNTQPAGIPWASFPGSPAVLAVAVSQWWRRYPGGKEIGMPRSPHVCGDSW